MRVRFPTAALIALTVVVGLLLSSATLASGASPNNPKADIQSGNGSCGADITTAPVIGFVNYHRTGDMVTVNFHLKGATPNASYQVELWGDICSFFGVMGTVTKQERRRQLHRLPHRPVRVDPILRNRIRTELLQRHTRSRAPSVVHAHS
jgi:hypothetical protein